MEKVTHKGLRLFIIILVQLVFDFTRNQHVEEGEEIQKEILVRVAQSYWVELLYIAARIKVKFPRTKIQIFFIVQIT